MKIGILTFHTVINYGGVLQAYALQTVLSGLCGRPVDIIDYHNRVFAWQYKPFSWRMLRHPKSLPQKISLIPVKKKRNEKFADFSRKYFSLYGNKIKKKDIAKAAADFDVLITGSDQVWNPGCTGKDFTYFLEFDCRARKYSYAASFAVQELDERYTERVRRCLEKFSGISVREEAGAKIVKQLLNQEVPVLPDPTLLLPADRWRKLESKVDGLPDKYLLVIQMGGEAEALIGHAKKYDSHMPVVFVNLSNRPIPGVINIRDASPGEWLYLIDHAEGVISNSFHGCVFSVLFHKEFFYELSRKKNSNSRLVQLARTLGLDDRNVENISRGETRQIDYDKVDRSLAAQREKGMGYLKNIAEVKM